MDVSMLDAAGQALLTILDPYRLMMLAGGVLVGLVIGILPGIGGLTGLALLLPFTFTMDPYAAFAVLIGLGSVTTTSDSIPAILFGVPGTVASQATVLDGLPMAKKGEAGRALAAAYVASMMGGLFGALLMAVSIPILRPMILYLGSPELLAFSVLGISMVASLSGNTPLRGLAVACLGIMIAMIGTDPQTGTLRWTLGSLYLWDGLPLVPAVLGLFALPELCDLAIKRSAIATHSKFDVKTGMWEGTKDVFRNWWLVLRCSWIGAGLGAIPGIGGSVVDWIAYGHAMRTEKGAQQTFGRGDVRGVIASESSNNAKEGGALVPTVAFGVPGSAGMAILLGAFLIQGLIPGPDMLSKNLNVTYAMVWSIALANVIGAGICFALSGQFAKLSTLRYSLILPMVLGILYIGAFQGTRSWGDLYALLLFGVVGWAMKQLKWPRPPLILGFVLGDIIERYMFISVERYGIDWMWRPVVLVLFALAIYGAARPLLQDIRIHGGVKGMMSGFARPKFTLPDLFPVFLIVLVGAMVLNATEWSFGAKVVPLTVGIMALLFTAASLLNGAFRARVKQEAAQDAKSEVTQKIHMDLVTDMSELPVRVILQRAGIFFGWLLAFMASMATIGIIPTAPLFVVLYMRTENREPWKLVIPQAIGLTIFIYVVFDQLLTIPWPPTFLGDWIPALKIIPSV
jgi:putative tricarboxylic transport membrane protein